QRVLEGQLDVRHHGGQLRGGQTDPGVGPSGDLLVRRQRLQFPVHTVVLDQIVDQPRVHRQHSGRVGATGSDEVVLPGVVRQDHVGDLIGHRHQQVGALVGADLAGGDQRVDEDLDVDLVVGAVDPGRVVQRVGVDPPAGEVVFDTPQ